MKRLLLLPLMLLIFGCAQNHFNVPVENYAGRVKTLGVAPIFIDEDSDILHPQKEQLISLVAQANRANEYQLVRKLKGTGNYYSVSLLDGDPRLIFSSLLSRREKRDDASIQYNKYFWKIEELREYVRKNNLDAVMLVVVGGLCKTDKVYSNTKLSSLTSDYNYLIMTAQILDKNGAILWEYPNFRGRMLKYSPMIALQYPDFNEAEANMSDKAEVKFKSIEGIRRRFNEKDKDMLLRETQITEVYAKQFDEMVSLLKFETPKEQATTPAPVKKTAPIDQSRPVAAPLQESGIQQPTATPAAPVVAPQATPEVKPVIGDSVGGNSDEIVPAAGK